MKSEHGPGCGHEPHPKHCLCDVVYVPPGVPVRYRFEEVEYGPQIARAVNHKGERSTLTRFLEALGYGYDRTRGVPLRDELFERYDDMKAPALLSVFASHGLQYSLSGLRKSRQKWRKRTGRTP